MAPNQEGWKKDSMVRQRFSARLADFLEPLSVLFNDSPTGLAGPAEEVALAEALDEVDDASSLNSFCRSMATW